MNAKEQPWPVNEWWNYDGVHWDIVHALRDSACQQNYWDTVLAFVALSEGCVLYPYPDLEHFSIGYGLLVKQAGKCEYEKLAVCAFKEVLGKDIADIIPLDAFNDNGALRRCRISQQEAEALLLYVLERNEVILRDSMPYFDVLDYNQRIALHSLQYNSPVLVGPKLKRNITMFQQTLDWQFLSNCVYEIEQNSNYETQVWVGIQNRRFREGAMFSNKFLDLAIRLQKDKYQKFLCAIKYDYCELYDCIQDFSYEEALDQIMDRGLVALPDIEYLRKILKRF